MRDTLMQRHAYSELLATEIAMLLLETLTRLTDNELIEVKRRVNRLQRSQRDAAIRAAACTGNSEELARRWGLSDRRVRQIVASRSAR